MGLGFYTHELGKNAKNRIVISFLSQTLCETVGHNWSCDKWVKLDHAFYTFLDPVTIRAAAELRLIFT